MGKHNADGTPSRNKRRMGRYVVKHRFQFRFALTIFVFLGVASIMVWLQGRWAIQGLADSGFAFNEDIVIMLELLNSVISTTMIIALMVVFGLSLILSHYMAGPIYRFERTLEAMAGGNLAVDVRIRKNDEFREVADLFNVALSALRSRLQAERTLVVESFQKMADVSESLKKAGRKAEAQEVDHLISEIKNFTPQIRI
jgi:signal peptidase II